MKTFNPYCLPGAAGLTLVELMLVLSIVSIILAAGVPGFQNLIQNQRLLTTTNDFFAAINLARAEAIHRGRRVDLVPAENADWSQGWEVFIDQNSNQIRDAGEKLIYSHGPAPSGLQIHSVFTDSSKPYLAYNGSGRTRTNASGQSPQLGTISFFLNGKIRRIKLNFLGRPRMCTPEQDRSCTGATAGE
jgi:type IV fimbrial biogenesis protein FimT